MKILPRLNSTDQGSFVEFSADCGNTNPLAVAVQLVGISSGDGRRKTSRGSPQQPWWRLERGSAQRAFVILLRTWDGRMDANIGFVEECRTII
jgi:hypothetical protein